MSTNLPNLQTWDIYIGMTKELKDQRIAVMLTPSELKAIDDWSFNLRIRSRGEAIRRLIQSGLSLPLLTIDLLNDLEAADLLDDPRLAKSAAALDEELGTGRSE